MKVARWFFLAELCFFSQLSEGKKKKKKMLVPTRVVFVDIENFYDYSFCKVLYQ